MVIDQKGKRVILKTETLVGAFMLLALGLVVYMSFQLGSVRLNLARYASYSISFKEVSNLLPKADIKISGVKVGWVDSIFLDPKDMQVKVYIKVLKEYKLYSNALAFVRQEGLFGVKYLEILPGSDQGQLILPGKSLPYQPHRAGSIDEIFTSVTTLAKQIERLGTSLEESTKDLRSLMQNLQQRLSNVDTLLAQVTAASESFQLAAAVVRKAGQQVSDFLPDDTASEGKQSGLVKMLEEDPVYKDVKSTSDFARTCVERVQSLKIGLDSHFEVLPHNRNSNYFATNVKWYFDTYVASDYGYFAKLGLTYASEGFARRKLFLCDIQKASTIIATRDNIRLNLQIGSYCHPYAAVRIGLFEGTAGVGIDWWVSYTHFKWLSTFEVFDFRGHNRFGTDCSPHLKWLNRFLITPHIYITAGVDDILSRCNRSGFAGIGAYFALPSFDECCE